MTSPTQPTHTNRLADETSPYLLQHAHNPVDWFGWGAEAIEKARAESKPIFLSIGYSACHWCHVMERESFENEAIAEAINEHFIAIKVDREERPDLDDLYMNAVQMLTGQGGWPMSVFLTPELEPFFGGTYFPPEDRGRMPGFGRLVASLAHAWQNDRAKIRESAAQISQAIRQSSELPDTGVGVGGEAEPQFNDTHLTRATRALAGRFDAAEGGFGSAPKFPPSMALNLLMREFDRSGETQLIEMVTTTLDKMARGGIYDHLGGGFARYSTDDRWLVPHFEKMLYDNALLVPVYLDAYLITGNELYERTACGVLDYIIREMTLGDGGYASAEDADSEGVEGKFYVWDKDEVVEILKGLGPNEAELFCDFFDVTEAGNFEGQNILNVTRSLEAFAQARDADPASIAARLEAARVRLFDIRASRVRPGRDDKVITAWNGMMISAMARGAQVTGDVRYLQSAEGAAGFILENLREADGTLLRTWRAGRAHIRAFCEDHAHLINGLIDLYETSFDPTWLAAARELAEAMTEKFFDAEQGAFFTTDGRDASVIVRRKEVYDGATPSGNSAAVFALLRLDALLDRPEFKQMAARTFAAMRPWIERQSGAVHHLLCGLSFDISSARQIAIIGDAAEPATRELLRTVWSNYLPARVLACASEDAAIHAGEKIALLRDKTAQDDKPTAYVCRNYSCRQPVTTAQALADLL